MLKRRVFLTLALASALTLAMTFTSCTTDSEPESDSENNVYAHIVGDWKIQAATVTPVAQIPTVPGVPSIPGAATTTANLLLVMTTCEKEATASFQADGVYLKTEGAGCNSIDSGTWARNDSTLYVTYTNRVKDPDTLTIIALSDTLFRLNERNDDLPDHVMRTITWTLVPR